MLARNRLVTLPWSCQRSGDCCASVSQIVMTPLEAAELGKARPDANLKFYYHADRRFVFLLGKPCPLLAWEGKKAVCTVHAVRPYNCRRFGCFRPDPTTEPYEPEAVDYDNARLGCANLSDRLSNRAVRRAYALLQRKAQKWALRHGWTQDMAPTAAGSDVVFYRMAPTAHTPQPVSSSAPDVPDPST